MEDDPLEGPAFLDARRAEAHFRRLGTRTPSCSYPGCLEREPAALVGVYPRILCYEHAQLLAGKSTREDQHPMGEANDDMTVSMPGNEHRIWDDAKRDWPLRTLQNPDESPLLKASAAVRTVLDWLRLLLDRVLGWVPRLLEALDDKLRALLGNLWWVQLGLEVP